MGIYTELLESVLNELVISNSSEFATKFKSFLKKQLVPTNGIFNLPEAKKDELEVTLSPADLKRFFECGLLEKKNNKVRITKKGLTLAAGGDVVANKEVDPVYYNKIISQYKKSKNAKSNVGKWVISNLDGNQIWSKIG